MKTLVVALFAVLFLIGSVRADADQEKDAKELVEKAVQLFSDKGNDYALRAVGSPNGPLRRDGGLYIFVFAFNGTALAHSVNDDLLGPQWELQDSQGNYLVQEFVAIAKDRGCGWSNSYWNRPGQTTSALKKTYIMRVPGEEILVGCGYYPE